jgi:hypothetical protein
MLVTHTRDKDAIQQFSTGFDGTTFFDASTHLPDSYGGGSWLPLGGVISGDGTVQEIVDPSPLGSGRRFYRIESEMEN